jgi:UDPglucose 6-dehydrogenase
VGAEAIVLLTEWDEFQGADWELLSRLVQRPLLLDGRNTLSAEQVSACGFQYVGIGGISAMPKTPPQVADSAAEVHV